MEREVIGYSRKDAEEVGLEVVDGNLGNILAVTARGNQFKLHLVFVPNQVFHCL